MLTLVHPAPEGQDPPKRRRRGIPSPALSLTHDEACAVRAAARNIARAQYGTLRKLAAALGVSPNILTRKKAPSAGLAVALARVSGMTVDAVLGRAPLARGCLVTRSRQRERERIRAPVDTTDAGALVGWAYSLRPLLVDLRELAEDATAPPSQRVCSRLYLRKQLLRALRELDARIAVVAPPLPFSAPTD